MTKLASLLPLLLAASLAHGQSPAPVVKGEFQKIQLTNEFWAEGATIGDFNHDGKMDVAYGPYWWEGPDFKVRHTYAPDTKKSEDQEGRRHGGGKSTATRAVSATRTSMPDNFFMFSHDFNGDGWADILVIAWFSRKRGLLV